MGSGASLKSDRGDFVVEEPAGAAVGQFHHHADAAAVGHLEITDGAGGIALQGFHQLGGDLVTHPRDPHLRTDLDGTGRA